MNKREITSEVVDHALAIRFSKLPTIIQNNVKKLITDGLGVMFEGLNHDNIQIIVDHLREIGSKSTSQILGHNFSASVTDAAFINGTAIHVMDYEPMFDPPTHAVSPVLGALMALILSNHRQIGINQERDGERFLNAFTAGIELQADLRTAAITDDKEAKTNKSFFPFQKQGFHPPGTVGVMGSALACSIWLGLSNEQTCMALGMAASRAGGIAGNIGTMTKATHCGNAARAGLECALLAKKGFTASSRTLEEPGGWGEVFGGTTFNHDLLVEGMKTLRCFTSPGFAFKYWPAHTAMQIAIQAGLALYDPERKYDGEIEIEVPVFKYCNRPFPKSSDDCRFSFQFNVVQALLDGEVHPESFTDEQLARKDIQKLLGKTKIKLLEEIPADFTKMEVRVKLQDGRSSVSDRWPGHWKQPATNEQIEKKFIYCSRFLFDKRKALEIMNHLNSNITKFNLDHFLNLLVEEKMALAA
jgi:aconitate decarboxylase